MPTVKIIQVLNHYDEEYQATRSDLARVTDWEEISENDMYILKRWLHDKNHNPYGSYREGPLYALMILPEEPVSAIESVKQVIEQQVRDEEKERIAREKRAKLSEEQKLARKRKQLENLKKELGEQ